MSAGEWWVALWTALTALFTALAAIGTVGVLIAALVQIATERRRRIQQEAEAKAERHREQARLIAGWVGPADRDGNKTPFYLLNGSAEPVYNVVATIVLIQGTAPSTGEEWQQWAKKFMEDRGEFQGTPVTTAAILLPGQWLVWIRGTGWSGVLSGRVAGEVAFTDRAGAHWVRRGRGELEELSSPPFQHFGLPGPYDLVTPEPIA